MEIPLLFYCMIAVFGLIFGSFFSMAAHRWPLEDKKDREWISTPSHCPKCRAKLKWYDNVPVFGWLNLRGKCRACGQPISPRYILMELGTCALWLLTAYLVSHFGMSGIAPEKITWVHVIFSIVFASLYFLTIIIDAETQLIPDEITITHFVAAWAFFFLARPDVITPGWQSSVIVMLALPAVFFGMAWMGWMGMGDVMLAAGFGALFGWPLGLVVTTLGFVLGGVVAIPLMLVLVARKQYKPGQHHLAFGPYLAVSAYLCMLCGQQLVGWYFKLWGLQLLPNWSLMPLGGWGH